MPELNQVIALNRRGVRGGRKTKRLTMETRSARRSTESAIWLLRALDSERGTRLPLGRIAVEKSGRSRRFLRCAVCHQAFSATSGSVFADGFPLSHNLRTAAGRGAPTAAWPRSEASRLAIMSAAPMPLPETSPMAIPNLPSGSRKIRIPSAVFSKLPLHPGGRSCVSARLKGSHSGRFGKGRKSPRGRRFVPSIRSAEAECCSPGRSAVRKAKLISAEECAESPDGREQSSKSGVKCLKCASTQRLLWPFSCVCLQRCLLLRNNVWSALGSGASPYIAMASRRAFPPLSSFPLAGEPPKTGRRSSQKLRALRACAVMITPISVRATARRSDCNPSMR